MHLRVIAAAALAASLAPATAASAQATVLDVDGRRLQPGTDTLAVYVVRGGDTTRTGSIIDELRVIAGDGGAAIQRVYVTHDRVLGNGLDSIFDQMRTLSPIRERVSGTLRSGELAFLPGRVDGWMHPLDGDSAGVEVPLPAGAYNAATFDLVLRAADLRAGWEADVQAFEGASRRLVPLMARVTGTERIDGHDCWRVAADFAGTDVTFWIDRETRQLRQQVMEIAPGVHMLFRAPRPVALPAHPT
jgi:hypothetical protein